MKKKERVHLKEDPFKIFIQKTLHMLQNYRKEILFGIGAIAVVILVVVGILYLVSGSKSADNRLYAEALEIQKAENMTVDQKIEKLSKMDTKSGISASIKLSLAALYYEKGDYQKAKETLDQFPGSKLRLLEDKKKFMEAQILAAQKKTPEALEQLNQLFLDSKCEIGKDFLLLTMAKIQLGNNQTEPAAANLKKLKEDFQQSSYTYEAQSLLDSIESK